MPSSLVSGATGNPAKDSLALMWPRRKFLKNMISGGLGLPGAGTGTGKLSMEIFLLSLEGGCLWICSFPELVFLRLESVGSSMPL